jgi:hypothetical protein
MISSLQRFRAKWMPVRVKKTRQNNIERTDRSYIVASGARAKPKIPRKRPGEMPDLRRPRFLPDQICG